MVDQKPGLSDLLNIVSTFLEDSGVEHILIGGLAVGLRGYPRSTIDVEMLVNETHLELAREKLIGNGFSCEAETEETLHFSGPGNVDFLIAKRPMSLQMLTTATSVEGVKVRVALAEDLIGLKIQAYHNDQQRIWKDKADIAELIRSNPQLDWDKIMKYAKLFGVEKEIEEIRNSIAR